MRITNNGHIAHKNSWIATEKERKIHGWMVNEKLTYRRGDVEAAQVSGRAVVDLTLRVQPADSVVGAAAGVRQCVHVHPVRCRLRLSRISDTHTHTPFSSVRL